MNKKRAIKSPEIIYNYLSAINEYTNHTQFSLPHCYSIILNLAVPLYAFSRIKTIHFSSQSHEFLEINKIFNIYRL